MSRLRTRAVLLVVCVALLPLVILGALSVSRARTTLLAEVQRSDHDLAMEAASQIEAFVMKHDELVRRASYFVGPAMHLSPEQTERMLKHYRLDAGDLRQLDAIGLDGHEIATGRNDGKTIDRGGDEAVKAALAGKSFRSLVTISQQDLVPELVLGAPQRTAGQVVGAVVATVDLTEMWRIVDRMPLGQSGYARVVGEDGTLLAVGRGALKPRVFTQQKDAASVLSRRVLDGESVATSYFGEDGREMFAVGVPIKQLGWALILEQPLDEALAPYRRFTKIIFAISTLLLVLAGIAGLLAARSVVRPIEKLRLRAGEIARGLLGGRIEIASPEELHALADAMNHMCADLEALQEDVKKKERIATLGRLAAGLAHDLKHPVRALQVNAKLVLARPDDPSVRQLFEVVVQREFKKLESFLDDLKRVSRDEPMRLDLRSIDVADWIAEFAREQQAGIAPAGVELKVEGSGDGLFLDGDRELLDRVLTNLTSNAYEAMLGEGRLTLRTDRRGECVLVDVGDNGSGIAPDRIAGLWNDFATTKRHGLGLGLAVCKKIVTDHGGSIAVRSEIGIGTHFVISLPLSPSSSPSRSSNVAREPGDKL